MENKGKSKNTIIKDAISLFLITLLAGVSLGLVYQVTKGPIQKEQQEAKQEAYQKVFQEAKAFEEDKKISQMVSDELKLEELGITGSVINEVLVATDQEGNMAGVVLSVTSKEGYGGDIDISMGVTKDGVITGIEILSMSETPGLGARITEEEFKNQFSGKKEQIEYTKTGKKKENEIDALSGATISTNAVTNGVNAGRKFAEYVMNKEE